MTKAKLNKIKMVKKLSRQTRIPPAKVIPSGKDKRKKEKRANWKKEIKEQMENEMETES